MKAYFLHHNPKAKVLIVFFSGFAFLPSCFGHLDSSADVVMLYDYRDFDCLELEIGTTHYQKTYLIAWSMGVCIASKILSNPDLYPAFISITSLKFDKKIAINGTNIGIDKSFGIPPAIFKLTAKRFNLESFKQSALERHYTKAKDYDFASLDTLIQELESLYTFCYTNDFCMDSSVRYDEALISDKDEVFPHNATLAFFAHQHTKIIRTSEPHFVFLGFKNWEEICNL